jgi:RNA polymerase sigma factor (sigma-70 family)
METNGEQSDRIRRVVTQYAQSLTRLAIACLGNMQDAEDATQEVFLAYLRSARVFEGAEHEKAWLIRVMINRCKNMVKSKWLRNRRPLPDNLSYRMREDSGVLGAVMALDEKYRLPIHLHYYEGYSIKEIAELLRARPATIGTRLARGKEQLRRDIGGILDE